MDIIKCEAFLQAVDSGSLSAAAEKWGYTPSGITRMVNALEAELGFPLLARSRKGVVLTADGTRLLPIIREMVRWNEQARQISAEIRGLAIGNLAIGTYYSVAAAWLPGIIKTFQADYPAIRINALTRGKSDLLAWLAERRVDCCFFSECDFNGDWIPLARDEMVALLPRDHPKANLPAFPLSDINGAPFIQILPGFETDVDDLLAREGLTPDIRFTAFDDYTAYSMVSAGLGISLDNKLTSQNWHQDVAVLPLNPPRYITLGLAVPSLKDASPALTKFIACTKRVIQASKV